MLPEIKQIKTGVYQQARMALRHLLGNDEMINRVTKDSFFDYHAKGLHYLSLGMSSDGNRMKLYFFDKAATGGSNVVCPHDHVYDFDTIVFTGEAEDEWFEETSVDDQNGDRHTKFSFDSPIRGGKNGFQFVEEVGLRSLGTSRAVAGRGWSTPGDAVHTLRIRRPETVLIMRQKPDDKESSFTFTPGSDREPPSLSGLYRKPSATEYKRLMRKILA